MGLKFLPGTPQSIPHSALCSGSFQREEYIPSFTTFLPPLKKTRSPSGMSILSPTGIFGLHPCMKSASSNELMFDQDHTSCTRKPCARPSLPPYLLYKVSNFCYDISFPLHCHLPSSLHHVRDGCEKASMQSRDHGVWKSMPFQALALLLKSG